jgi:phosphate transport system permease protein
LNVIERGEPKPEDPVVASRTVVRGSVASIFSKHRFFYAHLPFGTSVLSAGLTLALVILPIVVISTQEAIRAVPGTLREAAFGLGTTRWQMVRTVVLPSALPGIMTGTILAMGRAIGEAAPLLAVMRGVISNSTAPDNLMENSATLPVLIYGWAQDENKGFHDLSAAAILVLLVLLLLMNTTAILIRYRSERKGRS